jgi:hypothetical protein
MADRKETSHQVITRYKDKTETWEKNNAGCTTKEGHRTHYHDSGNVTNHYGRIIGNTKRS